jgi:hypothetical protein
MLEIASFINRFDVGVFSHQEQSVQATYVLPNKFFEFVQARLALVIGPSPEMVALLEQHDLGVVARDFSASELAAAISNLDRERVKAFKTNAHMAAGQLSAEHTMPSFVQQVRALAGVE